MQCKQKIILFVFYDCFQSEYNEEKDILGWKHMCRKKIKASFQVYENKNQIDKQRETERKKMKQKLLLL